jgi:hypothetical protein
LISFREWRVFNRLWLTRAGRPPASGGPGASSHQKGVREPCASRNDQASRTSPFVLRRALAPFWKVEHEVHPLARKCRLRVAPAQPGRQPLWCREASDSPQPHVGVVILDKRSKSAPARARLLGFGAMRGRAEGAQTHQ